MKSDLGDELPPIASGDAGKVLKVNAGETAVEWAVDQSGNTYTAGTGIDITSNVISSTVVGIPSTAIASEGDILSVDGSGNAEWVAPVEEVPSYDSSNIGQVLGVQEQDTRGMRSPVEIELAWVDLPEGETYSAGEGIAIDENNEISVDYETLDVEKIGNIVDEAFGFGVYQEIIWEDSLPSELTIRSDTEPPVVPPVGDDIKFVINGDAYVLPYEGQTVDRDDLLETWTDGDNTFIYAVDAVSGDFHYMELQPDSGSFNEGDPFTVKSFYNNPIPADFIPVDGTSITVNQSGNLAVDDTWLEDFVNDIVNPPATLNRLNIAEQGSSALIDTYGTTYDMELTQENKYFVAITDVTLPAAIDDQTTYNYLVNTSVGAELTQITPIWEDVAGGPAGMWYFQGTDSLVQFAMDSDDALSATVRVFYNKPAEESELPAIVSGDAGKVLKVNSLETGVEWANESTELPSIAAGDAGKVLKVNSGETGVEWGTAGGGSSPVKVITITTENNPTLSADDIAWLEGIITRGYDEGVTYVYYSGVRMYKLECIEPYGPMITFISTSDMPTSSTGKNKLGNLYRLTFKFTKSGNVYTYNNMFVSTPHYNVQQVYYSYSGNTEVNLKTVVDGKAEYPSFTSNAGKVLAVNSGATGVEWISQGRAMPGDPNNDGDYKLVNTVDNGMSVLSWEVDSGGGGGSVSDPLEFESTHSEGDPYNFSSIGNDLVKVGYDEYGEEEYTQLTSCCLDFTSRKSGYAAITMMDEVLQDGETTESRLLIDPSGGAVIISGLRLWDNQSGELYDITVENGVLTATLWEDPTTQNE